MDNVSNQDVQTTAPAPDWDKILPEMFIDRRFTPSGRRRYQALIDGVSVGIVVAFKPHNYENYGLNHDDMAKLIYFQQERHFQVIFVVLATDDGNGPIYVGHRDAVEVDKAIGNVKCRQGPWGEYWLLRPDFMLIDYQLRIQGW